MLDLRRMMLLADLADLGTVTAVAQRRNITSSAVSQQLRVLEGEAGAVLFRKEGRALSLTRSGQVLVEHVRRVLSAVDEAASALAASESGTSSHVVMGAFNMAVSLFAVPLVQRLGAGASGLQVQVQQHLIPSALRLLRQGELDLAVTCTYDFGGEDNYNGLLRHELLTEPLVLVAPSHVHRIIRNEGLAALADEPWVTGGTEGPLNTAVQRIGAHGGFTPKIKHRLDGAQNICELAATEMAAAVVPLYAIPRHLHGLVVQDATAGSRTYNAVVRQGRRRDPKLSAIIRELKHIAAGIGMDLGASDRLGVAS
jgi:DNA-binding transcriptional LysR family regulator